MHHQAPSDAHISYVRNIRGGVPHNVFVDARQAQRCTRGTCSGFSVNSTIETMRFDTYPNRFGYVSDTYQCAPALCLEAVSKGYPLLRLFQRLRGHSINSTHSVVAVLHAPSSCIGYAHILCVCRVSL